MDISQQAYWAEIDRRILKWGLGFIGRVPEEILRDDLNLLDFNERDLAVECLISHIYEYDAPVSISELNEAIDITAGWPDIAPHIDDLRKLLRSEL